MNTCMNVNCESTNIRRNHFHRYFICEDCGHSVAFRPETEEEKKRARQALRWERRFERAITAPTLTPGELLASIWG